jgi:hypothetical protein
MLALRPEITHDPLLFNVAQHAVHHIYKRGGEGSLYGTHVLCSLATVTSCIDASVRIVTKSPKVGTLRTYILHLSVCVLRYSVLQILTRMDM